MNAQDENSPSREALLNLESRLAVLEARYAGSWACHTREEYEKSFKSDIKQEILGYVTKIAVGLLIFLGGAGAVFVKLSIDSTYQSENAKVIQNLQARYDAQVREARTRAEWERFHNYGVTYRYLAELYSNAPLEPKVREKEMDTVFMRAKTYYDLALRTDPRQPSTHFELAQLYHTYANQFDVLNWRDDQKAEDEYQAAIDVATQDDISRGWRAQSLTMLGEVEIGEVAVATGSAFRRALLDKAQGHLQQARGEYERAIPEVAAYNQPWLEKTNQLLSQAHALDIKIDATASSTSR